MQRQYLLQTLQPCFVASLGREVQSWVIEGYVLAGLIREQDSGIGQRHHFYIVFRITAGHQLWAVFTTVELLRRC